MSNYSSNNKRIAKNTLLLYFRSLLLLGLSLYTSRIVLKALGVEDYGVYNIVGGFVAMFHMITGTLATATQRFITFSLGRGDDAKVRKIFSNSLLLHIILGAIIVMLLEVFGMWFMETKLNIPIERLNAAKIVLQCSILTMFVTMISVPFNALIIAHEKMNAFAYIGIFEGVLKFSVAYFLLYWHEDKLITYGILLLCVSIIVRVLYSSYCTRKFEESRNTNWRIDKDIFKEMFSFSGWNLFGQASMVFRNQGIDVLLNIFFGVTVNAAKGVCNQVQQGVYQLVSNFQTAVRPQLTKAVAQNDSIRIFSLTIQGSRFSFYMMSLFTLPIIVSCNELLSLWLTSVPDYAVLFVQWTMFYLLLDTQSRFLMHNIMSTGNIRNYQIVIGTTKMLTLPFAYLALVLWGSPLVGILANIVIEIVCMFERLYYNKKQIGLPVIRFLYNAFFKCFAIILLPFMLSMAFHTLVSDNLIINILLSLGLTTLFIFFLGLNRPERQMMLGFVNKIKNR